MLYVLDYVPYVEFRYLCLCIVCVRSRDVLLDYKYLCMSACALRVRSRAVRGLQVFVYVYVCVRVYVLGHVPYLDYKYLCMYACMLRVRSREARGLSVDYRYLIIGI